MRRPKSGVPPRRFFYPQTPQRAENINYANKDIVKERAALNVLFKSCPGTYEPEFSRMVSSGEISMRGLKLDAKAFDEFVFYVNSECFIHIMHSV